VNIFENEHIGQLTSNLQGVNAIGWLSTTKKA